MPPSNSSTPFRRQAVSRTLRFRMMLWIASTVVVTALAVLLGLRAGIQFALLHELDVILLEDMQEITLALERAKPLELSTLQEELQRKAEGHRQHGWFSQLLGHDETVLWSTSGSPAESFAMPDRADSDPVTVGALRVLQHRVRNPADAVSLVRVGLSRDMIGEDVRRLDELAILVALVVGVLAPLCAYWLAGRATAPLTGMIDTAARLRPSHLEERLPLRQSGDELDKLAVTINGLLDRVAEHHQMREDFLANSAHELRSPLAAIRSTAEVALNAGRSPDEYGELLGDIIDECAALESLVNQLLLLAEAESERLKIAGSPVRLDQLVNKAVEMFQALADAHDVRLTCDSFPETTVIGNSHHLRQVLNNLLDNALKFTPAGGFVRVSATRDDRSRHIELRIQDTGAGIASDDLPHIFERFFRADRARQRDTTTRGTGLGLCICEAVVRAHGGTIRLESELGRGTTASVRLPLA